MKISMFFWLFFLFLAGCKTGSSTTSRPEQEPAGIFRIAFGSCNDTDRKNDLWDDILTLKPDLWIWGGDNIYADTDNMEELKSFYLAQKQIPGYQALLETTPVIGTWDDHDFGINDGGTEFKAKKGSQQEFLDFMGVPENSPRRKREGVYTSHTYTLPQGEVKVIILDTRYFRSALTRDPSGEKRFVPNQYGEGTILGVSQWRWLEAELTDSDADFNILVSSVQLLSGMHGFETWGNFPHEVDRMADLVGSSGARGVIILSGDRHISEFSRSYWESVPYPLIDFTSSGLTHSYKRFKGEPNPYRVGAVVVEESFGFLVLDVARRKANFQIRGDQNQVLLELSQQY